MSTVTLKTPPTRVTQDELDAMERMGGKDSYAYQRLAEQRAAWQEWESQRDAEEARLRQAREAGRAAAAKERADAQDAERAADEAAIRADIRRRFFAANPSASATDYERLAEQLYDSELIRRAEAGRDADVEALRRSGNYSF